MSLPGAFIFQKTKNEAKSLCAATGVVKRSNATNESLSFGSQQGATRSQWFPPFQELQRSCGANDELPQGRRQKCRKDY